jgi:FkbM family methyltransferase
VKGTKALLRSRSFAFTRDYVNRQSPGGERGTIARVDWWNGDGRPVAYRRGTSDVSLVYDVLFKPGRKSEYWLPAGLEPKLVLDIGGNIGVVARYLSHRFPGAAIHAFEPIEDNVGVLKQNVAGSAVTVHPYGLGKASGTVEFAILPGAETNWAGYSMLRRDGDAATKRQAQVRDVREVLGTLGGAQVDLIKIDAEGAEADILEAIPDEVLARVTWIYGEIHGAVMDPGRGFRILERLAGWFDIEVHKGLRMRNWFFDACSRNASGRFAGLRRGR